MKASRASSKVLRRQLELAENQKQVTYARQKNAELVEPAPLASATEALDAEAYSSSPC